MVVVVPVLNACQAMALELRAHLTADGRRGRRRLAPSAKRLAGGNLDGVTDDVGFQVMEGQRGDQSLVEPENT